MCWVSQEHPSWNSDLSTVPAADGVYLGLILHLLLESGADGGGGRDVLSL